MSEKEYLENFETRPFRDYYIFSFFEYNELRLCNNIQYNYVVKVAFQRKKFLFKKNLERQKTYIICHEN